MERLNELIEKTDFNMACTTCGYEITAGHTNSGAVCTNCSSGVFAVTMQGQRTYIKLKEQVKAEEAVCG